MRPERLAAALLACAALAGVPAASAQPAPSGQERKLGPANSAELGLVIASGNARSTSIGLRNVYTYRWARAELRWEGGWLRAASRDGDRVAVQSGSGFVVVEPGTAIDSQRLFSKLHYQRQAWARTDWFVDYDAVRDEPSNIRRQFVVAAGLGTTWWKTDRATFRTGYGFSATDESLVIEGRNRFGGYRVFYGLQAPLAGAAALESELTADGSFDEAGDIRADWLNGLSVALNSQIALKSSVRLLFRNRPALQTIPLRTPAGLPAGTVDVAKEKIDTNLTTSLVIRF